MDIRPNARTSVWQRAAPALLMMILAPTFTELLLGGTRLSTLIAFPPVLLLEILVWAGGAVLLMFLFGRRMAIRPPDNAHGLSTQEETCPNS